MENRWSDLDAEAAVERYTKQGVSLDVALRTYTTRLLGQDPLLVLHGGGNTSVKTRMTDLVGETHEVLKNFPTAEELAAAMRDVSREAHLESLRYYWLLVAELK